MFPAPYHNFHGPGYKKIKDCHWLFDALIMLWIGNIERATFIIQQTHFGAPIF
jgi:hypothetical protein